MKKQIVSVLIFPYPAGVRVEITRQGSIFSVDQGRLTRYYHSRTDNMRKLKSLINNAGKLQYLMAKRMEKIYEEDRENKAD